MNTRLMVGSAAGWPPQMLIDPVEQPETDLLVDAEHIREYVAFMDSHVKPLLSQAVKAAMRARSEDMLTFVIKFLEDANVQMRQLRCSDRMLRSCKVSRRARERYWFWLCCLLLQQRASSISSHFGSPPGDENTRPRLCAGTVRPWASTLRRK
jgi:hypothetical protein